MPVHAGHADTNMIAQIPALPVVVPAQAARQVGIAFGAVTWGYASPTALAALEPAEFFRSVDEIVPALTR